MDGMDAVVARPGSRQIEVLASHTFGFDDSLRAALSDLRRNPDVFPSMRLARLDAALGDALAAAALEIIEMPASRPAATTPIGSNDQPVRSEDPTSELQHLANPVCRLPLKKKKHRI